MEGVGVRNKSRKCEAKRLAVGLVGTSMASDERKEGKVVNRISGREEASRVVGGCGPQKICVFLLKDFLWG